VENAVRHGLAQKSGVGHIRVSTHRENGLLTLQVEDDGVGLATPSQSRGEGVGLRSTRTRLSALYGEQHRFELTTPANGGTLAFLEIPYRTEEK
jgi:LytS/YehU family sensor histidine kinase